MTLTCAATVADRGVDVQITVETGQTVALLGPNGSGKSTLLGLLAGTVAPDAGRASLDGRALFDVGQRHWTPSHARGVGLLAQDALLFPHLSALDNVAFGPRSTGQSRAGSRTTAMRWLAHVDAEQLANRRPAQLSGGQAQRVAIARALAAEPSLLLLDEPMAALDATAVPAMRQLLRTVLADRTAIIVTHDVLDALVLADSVLVMDGGRVVESGPTREVLARPRSPFVAGLTGLNMLQGHATPGGVDTAWGTIHAVAPLPPAGVPALVTFSPAAVSVHTSRPSGSPRNVVKATVTDVVPHGSGMRVHTPFAMADVTVQAVADLALVPGADVFLAVKASEVTAYPA